MNQDKTKEAFEAFWNKNYEAAHDLQDYDSCENLHNNKSHFNKFWLAGVEWIMSQASEKKLRDISEEYASLTWDLIQDSSGTIVPEDICNAFVDGYQQAKLSSMKELSEKDARIKELESELRKAFPMIKLIGEKNYGRDYPLAAELAKKENL